MLGSLMSALFMALPLAAAEPSFEKQIGPLLAARCTICHNAKDHKGGLSLVDRDAAMAGGESGEVIVAGDPAASLLVDYITGPKAEMPKED